MRMSWVRRNRVERKHSPASGDHQRRGVRAAGDQLRPWRGARRDLRPERLHQGRDAARLPKSVYKSVVATIEKGAKLDPAVADSVASAMKDWALGELAEGLGHREGRHPLRPRLLPADRPHRREARQLPRARRRRRGAGRVRRQDADPGRARRLQLPLRRHARHLRGPRLHRLGRHQPGLHPGEPQRHHAVHPDGLRLAGPARRSTRRRRCCARMQALDAQAQRILKLFGHKDLDHVVSLLPAPSRSTS